MARGRASGGGGRQRPASGRARKAATRSPGGGGSAGFSGFLKTVSGCISAPLHREALLAGLACFFTAWFFTQGLPRPGLGWIQAVSLGVTGGILFAWLRREGVGRLSSVAALALGVLSVPSVASILEPGVDAFLLQMPLCAAFLALERAPSLRERPVAWKAPWIAVGVALPFVVGKLQGETWTFDLMRPVELLIRDWFRPFTPSASALGGVAGLPVSLALFGAALWVARFRSALWSHRTFRFAAIWTASALLLTAVLPRGESGSVSAFRQGVALVPPLVLLLGIALDALMTLIVPGGLARWFSPSKARKAPGHRNQLDPALVGALALASAAALQLLLSAVHSMDLRVSAGRPAVAVHETLEVLRTKFKGQSFVLMPDLAAHALVFGDGATATVLADPGDVHRQSQGTLVLSWRSTLDASLTHVMTVSECAFSFFDFLAGGCGTGKGMQIMRYLGPPQEVADAGEQEKNGALGQAVDTLSGYLTRVPGNHGAWFVLGYYAYRAGRFDLAESAFDRIAPYFSWHPSVTYNLALTKMARKKPNEALRLLRSLYDADRGNRGVALNLAAVYRDLDLKEEALVVLKELLQANPDDASVKNLMEQWQQ